MTGQYRVLLFARYAELLGGPEVRLDLPVPATTRQVVDALRLVPGGALLPDTPFVAVNGRHADLHTGVTPSDELALLPPLAGG